MKTVNLISVWMTLLHVLTSCCMNCCQSAILPLALWVWVEPTFSEVDMDVQGAVLLDLLQQHTHTHTEEEILISGIIHKCILYYCVKKKTPLSITIPSVKPPRPLPLGCPSPYCDGSSHLRSPLCSSLRRPGPCGTRTGPLCCWSQKTLPPGTRTHTGPAGAVRIERCLWHSRVWGKQSGYMTRRDATGFLSRYFRKSRFNSIRINDSNSITSFIF